jgi:hypothetical protein
MRAKRDEMFRASKICTNGGETRLLFSFLVHARTHERKKRNLLFVVKKMQILLFRVLVFRVTLPKKEKEEILLLPHAHEEGRELVKRERRRKRERESLAILR